MVWLFPPSGPKKFFPPRERFFPLTGAKWQRGKGGKLN